MVVELNELSLGVESKLSSDENRAYILLIAGFNPVFVFNLLFNSLISLLF